LPPSTPEARQSEDLSTLNKRKEAPPVPGVLDVILKRWSPRAFSDREVSPEDLAKLFEAARWAASSNNEQPWRFILGRRGDETYTKILSALNEWNERWAKHAPVLVLSTARKAFASNGAANRFHLHDTGAATANIFLEAFSLGFFCHGMAGFDAEKARSSFAIPQEYEIGAVVAIGYLGDPNTLPDPLREREKSPRERKPLEEIVFSSWETPARL
jgi:nitroreductase